MAKVWFLLQHFERFFQIFSSRCFRKQFANITLVKSYHSFNDKKLHHQQSIYLFTSIYLQQNKANIWYLLKSVSKNKVFPFVKKTHDVKWFNAFFYHSLIMVIKKRMFSQNTSILISGNNISLASCGYLQKNTGHRKNIFQRPTVLHNS